MKRKMTKPFNTKKFMGILGIILAVVIIGAVVCLGLDFTGFIDNDGSLVPVKREDGKINVLLLGTDVEGLRTDAIMIASYDIKENKVNMLSIPRDTRMYVGSKYQKINAAHAIGGMKGKIAGPEGSVEAVTRLTGIPINYYIEFSFSAIDKITDILGPIEFDVPDVEGNGEGMNYDDPVQDLHIHLKPGLQKLEGNEVQQLLRYRKSNKKDKNGNRIGYPDGDRGRVATQQAFIKALVEQKVKPSLILKLPEIFSEFSKVLKTNVNVADVTKYAKYLDGFSGDKITAYQLPGEGKTIGGGSYFVCDLEATKILIEETFGYDASKITIDSPDGKNKDKSSDKKSTPKPTAKATPKPTEKSTSKPTVLPTSTPKDDNTATTKPTASPDSTPKATKKPDDNVTATTPPKDVEKSTPKPTATPKPVKTAEPEKTNGGTSNSGDDVISLD